MQSTMISPMKTEFSVDDLNSTELKQPINYLQTDLILSGKEVLQIKLLTTVRILLIITFITVYFIITSVCNITALIILFQKVFMRSSFSMGQRFLSIFDLGLSLVSILGYMFKWRLGYDISEWDTELCRIYKTSYFIIVACSNWTVVYLTALRYISIKSPVKVNTNAFTRRSYFTLLFTSIALSIYYILFYHEFTRHFYNGRSMPETDECFAFADTFPINEYVFRIGMMVPEFIAPVICVASFNYLLYKEFMHIGVRRRLLRQELAKHCKRISQIKSSLTDSETINKPNSHPSATGVSSPAALVHTFSAMRSSDPVDDMDSLNSARYVIHTSGGLQHRVSTESSSVEYPDYNNKTKLLHKLEIEKRQLRRATVAYGLLRDLELSSMRTSMHPPLQPQRRRYEPKNQVMNTLFKIQRDRSKTLINPARQEDSSTAFRTLLLMNTLLFILLFSPYSLWYIVSPAIYTHEPLDIALNRLANTISLILQCIGHACNFLIYIYSNAKVRQEGVRMFKKYYCLGSHTPY